jgi:1-acyl-sn-glycerol-3-phosphate acyltransferase
MKEGHSMFLFAFYVFIAVYTGLFVWVVPVDFFEPQNYLWYIFVVVGVLIGYVLSFITMLLFLQLLGLLRRNKPINDPTNHKIANSLLRLGLHLMRTKVIVTGTENIPKGQFVLVGNHQENYDIIILKPIFKDHQLSFIAKEALKKMPIFGRWIAILGNVFISRFADRQAAEAIITGVKHYKKGMSMGIFPEGKRSFGNEMIEFKSGAFKLAMRPKADLLVATQYNTCKIFKSFPWRRYKVYVHVHPLIPYDTYKDMNSHQISEHVKTIIQEQLDEFKRRYN